MSVSDLPPPPTLPDREHPATAPPRSQRSRRARCRRAASAPAAADRRARPKVDPELEARRKKAEGEKAAKREGRRTRRSPRSAPTTAARASARRDARSGMRIARVNAKGEREILDDKQRAAEMQRARQRHHRDADCRLGLRAARLAAHAVAPIALAPRLLRVDQQAAVRLDAVAVAQRVSQARPRGPRCRACSASARAADMRSSRPLAAAHRPACCPSRSRSRALRRTRRGCRARTTHLDRRRSARAIDLLGPLDEESTKVLATCRTPG